MKAREFVINVPINIKIDGDGTPNLDMPNTKPADQVPDEEKVTMSPLDQELEMRKAEMGKQSKYVDQILSEPDDLTRGQSFCHRARRETSKSSKPVFARSRCGSCSCLKTLSGSSLPSGPQTLDPPFAP